MFKNHKRLFLLVSIVIAILSSSMNVFAAGEYIDKSQINNGIIKVNYVSSNGVAVRVSKGGTSYDYILGNQTGIPLQLGNGDYDISVLSNVGGNKYKQIHKETVTVNLSDSNDIYLQSIQMINFNSNMEAVKLAKGLTKNASSDKEKVQIIYDYIVSNISYDTPKIGTMASNYLPSIDETLSSKKGICYDYSALFAGMLRSIGIPTKLMMGYKDDIDAYHAWNQIYLSETNEWITVDATYGAGYKSGNVQTAMIRSASEYSVEKQY